jgi:hypothetical protein
MPRPEEAERASGASQNQQISILFVRQSKIRKARYVALLDYALDIAN